MLKPLKLRPYYFVFVLDVLLIAITFIAAILYHNRNIAVKQFIDLGLLTKTSVHICFAVALWLAFKINKRIIKYYKASDYIRLIAVIFLVHTCSFLFDICFKTSHLKFGIVAITESFFVSIFTLVVTRFVISFLYEKFMIFHNDKPLKKILIYGAGERGTILKKSIEASLNKKYVVVGFIDDDEYKISRYVSGVKIYSRNEAIKKFIITQKVNRIIIASGKLSPKTKSDFINEVLPYKVKVKQVDSVSNWYDNDFNYSKLTSININDLMSRDIIIVNNENIADNLIGKVVMVTGAAGSIGSELVRKLSENNCDTIVCIDFSESALYDLQQELIKKKCYTNFYFELADIKDKNYLYFLFSKYRPNAVFHAAAYKHVPMMEEFPWQAIHTNVNGTWNVATLAIEFEVDKFILISTDKAVNPTSLMGVSKRLAEIIVRSLANQLIHTKFSITRFGNVLGSNGSVLPLFKKQIISGGPVTVTHPEMERYFMTIPEACNLVLEAFTMGKGEDVFVFDMGKPVRIEHLAVNMIRLTGLEPNVDIKIEYIGTRKGEKLSEEIFSDKETLLPTHHNKIFVSGERKFDKSVALEIVTRLSQFYKYDANVYRKLLNDVLVYAETDYQTHPLLKVV
jgi:FlaA1/EpsC-like NDP-sugar epimerase